MLCFFSRGRDGQGIVRVGIVVCAVCMIARYNDTDYNLVHREKDNGELTNQVSQSFTIRDAHPSRVSGMVSMVLDCLSTCPPWSRKLAVQWLDPSV